MLFIVAVILLIVLIGWMVSYNERKIITYRPAKYAPAQPPGKQAHFGHGTSRASSERTHAPHERIKSLDELLEVKRPEDEFRRFRRRVKF